MEENKRTQIKDRVLNNNSFLKDKINFYIKEFSDLVNKSKEYKNKLHYQNNVIRRVKRNSTQSPHHKNQKSNSTYNKSKHSPNKSIRRIQIENYLPPQILYKINHSKELKKLRDNLIYDNKRIISKNETIRKHLLESYSLMSDEELRDLKYLVKENIDDLKRLDAKIHSKEEALRNIKQAIEEIFRRYSFLRIQETEIVDFDKLKMNLFLYKEFIKDITIIEGKLEFHNTNNYKILADVKEKEMCMINDFSNIESEIKYFNLSIKKYFDTYYKITQQVSLGIIKESIIKKNDVDDEDDSEYMQSIVLSDINNEDLTQVKANASYEVFDNKNIINNNRTNIKDYNRLSKLVVYYDINMESNNRKETNQEEQININSSFPSKEKTHVKINLRNNNIIKTNINDKSKLTVINNQDLLQIHDNSQATIYNRKDTNTLSIHDELNINTFYKNRMTSFNNSNYSQFTNALNLKNLNSNNNSKENKLNASSLIQNSLIHNNSNSYYINNSKLPNNSNMPSIQETNIINENNEKANNENIPNIKNRINTIDNNTNSKGFNMTFNKQNNTKNDNSNSLLLINNISSYKNSVDKSNTSISRNNNKDIQDNNVAYNAVLNLKNISNNNNEYQMSFHNSNINNINNINKKIDHINQDGFQSHFNTLSIRTNSNNIREEVEIKNNSPSIRHQINNELKVISDKINNTSNRNLINNIINNNNNNIHYNTKGPPVRKLLVSFIDKSELETESNTSNIHPFNKKLFDKQKNRNDIAENYKENNIKEYECLLPHDKIEMIRENEMLTEKIKYVSPLHLKINKYTGPKL